MKEVGFEHIWVSEKVTSYQRMSGLDYWRIWMMIEKQKHSYKKKEKHT